MKLKFLLFSLSFLTLGFSQNAQAQCAPNYLFGCALGDDINTFTVNGINSTSINSVNTSCATAGDYEDFTNDSVTFSQGATYSASINSEASNDFVQVYIDFDNNNVFSSTESVGGMNNMAVAPSLSTFNIVIPGTAALGPHKMRVVVSGDSTYPGINPCPWYIGLTGYGGGEVHDYIAVISGTTTVCAVPTGVTQSLVTSTTATVSWTAVTGAQGYQYAVNTSMTPPTTGTYTTNISAPVTGLTANTTYHTWVRTVCGVGDSSAWNPMHMFNTLPTTSVAGVSGSNFSLDVYPNPVKNVVTIAVSGNQNGTATVHLTDITGKLVNSYTLTGTELNIDMSGLSSGVYFLRYTDSEHRQTIKINKE